MGLATKQKALLAKEKFCWPGHERNAISLHYGNLFLATYIFCFRMESLLC